MGAGSIATVPIIARWSFDGLVHAVSIDNPKNKEGMETRDLLAMSVYVSAYESSDGAQGYTLKMLLDILMLFLFIIAFLALTMWALKRKDVL
jgi:hypothetical protein